MKKTYLFIFIFVNIAIVKATDKLPIIAHWSFDNDSGTSLIDSGPNKLNAILKSKNNKIQVVTAAGVKGKALVLRASPNFKYVVKNKKSLLNLKPPYTICCWIKRTGNKPPSMCIFSKKIDSKPTGYGLRIDWFRVDHRIGNGGKSLYISSSFKSIKNKIWYHIAVTNDGNKVTTFINGNPVKIKTIPKKLSKISPAESKCNATIGNYPGRGNIYNFIGLIDELYLIGKAVSADELFMLADPESK